MPAPLGIVTLADIDVVARTIWGEARSESHRGMEAVACVIVNRWQDPTRWPESPAEVCLEPLQFSCWNSNDPGRRAVQTAALVDPLFLGCFAVAAQSLAGFVQDRTGGANHYVNPALVKWDSPKSWWVQADRGGTPSMTIGRHRFWRL